MITAPGLQPSARGRIGPNAVIRIADVLRDEFGEAICAEIFSAAGLSRYLVDMPDGMIDEGEVVALHRVLHERLGVDKALSVGRQAGLRTADYLLGHRIPRVLQFVLRHLPAALSSRILLGAITRHAWTFAGSGTFRVETGSPLHLTIAGGPIRRGAPPGRPACDFYVGTFERLYRRLVHPGAIVRETECEACGAPACRFEIRW